MELLLVRCLKQEDCQSANSHVQKVCLEETNQISDHEVDKSHDKGELCPIGIHIASSFGYEGVHLSGEFLLTV